MDCLREEDCADNLSELHAGKSASGYALRYSGSRLSNSMGPESATCMRG